MTLPILKLLEYVEKAIADLDNAIKKRSLRKTKTAFEKLTSFSDCLKELLPEDFIKENFRDFERHMHFIEIFLKKKDFEWIRSNFDDIIKEDFPDIKSKIYTFIGNQKAPEKRVVPLSNRVFIVHGRNHEPMKELKAMLKNFGLNPVVLHEQPSGSRTIVEKLERYSDVGYAFVILSPDDAGYCQSEVEWLFSVEGYSHPRLRQIEYLISNSVIEPDILDFLLEFKERARQNVVLEFGYFIGKLNRDRVCCLLKGDVERPSDMHGIVYKHFKESINEVKDEIVKELKAAGYEIKI